jgi:hypothetical protein
MASEGDTPLTFDWEGTPAPDPAAPQPTGERPRRRVAPRFLALAVAAAVVGGALAVALSSGGSSTGQGGPVALAAAVTNREPGFKFEMTISANAGGQNADVDASGSINTGPPPSVTMNASVGGESVNERIVGSDLYIQSPLAAGKWLHTALPPSITGDGAAGSSTQLTSADPEQTLDFLRAAGTVTDVGSDTIGGVATTHYPAVIELSRYASALPAAQQATAAQGISSFEQATGLTTLPMDVWIDASNLVRQIQFSLSISGQGSIAFTMSFSDYGPQPAVSAPPASDVIEAPAAQTPSAPAQTPSTPPVSTPPASAPSSGSGSAAPQPAD